MVKLSIKGRVFIVSFAVGALSFGMARVSFAQLTADDCSLAFQGSIKARKDVKLRTANDGAAYALVDNGKPITVARWLEVACDLNSQIQPDFKIPTSEPIPNIETKKVTIQGYLLAAKFEGSKTGDRDIHAEISDTNIWRSKHMIIEVPPGNEYCSPRKKLWQMITDDPAKMKSGGKILDTPVKVTVTGYVFLDAAHGADCVSDGGRGMLKDGKGDQSQVVGLYEIHPVLDISRTDN